MSASFEIASSTGNYTVDIAPNNLQNFLSNHKNIVAICDERFAPMLEQAGVKTIALHADETVKNLAALPDIITKLRQANTTRDTCLLAVGGGIVQDVAAFCAAIYMRGLSWVYAPTTLLGMADSCIGGKSSINVGAYKNIVGTFNPPQQVLIDTNFTMTLSAEHRAAGLIEAAKICYCRGQDSWAAYLACDPSLSLTADGYGRVITTSLAAKKWFIETDEFDRKERLLLNFGHTFGHALEGASDYRLSHGIAVGIGMLCALTLGQRMNIDYSATPQVGVLRDHVRALLLAVQDLPSVMKGITAASLFDRFAADKKHKVDVFRVVTVATNGAVELISLPKTDAARNQITAAMDSVMAELRAGN